MSVSTPSPLWTRRRMRSPSHKGRNSGYFSTSATSSYICIAVCGTRRVVRKDGIARPSAARPGEAGRLEAREVLAGVMRRAGQRRRRDEQEALGVGGGLVALELVRRDEPQHRVMLASRLEVLADGQEIDLGRTQVIHELQ